MEFKISSAACENMFAVSAKVTDESLRLASGVQLKVILYLFRHGIAGNTVAAEEIAQAIGRDLEEITDALIFWQERGVAQRTDRKAETQQPKVQAVAVSQPEPALPKTVQQEKKSEKKVAEIPIVMPSHEQVAARCTECADFRLLFAEAQSKLGKTIGYDGQAVLIMLHDSYGLPIEVILMLIEYAKSKGRTGYSYISKLGKSWAEKEIDTLEAAESYIERQSGVDELWSQFRSMSLVKNAQPTTKQRRFFETWKNAYGFDAQMIYCAYEISIEQTEKMSVEYMDKVLKSWSERGIRTPDDVKKDNENWAKSKGKKKSEPRGSAQESGKSSYDLTDFEKRSIGLKYKKN